MLPCGARLVLEEAADQLLGKQADPLLRVELEGLVVAVLGLDWFTIDAK